MASTEYNAWDPETGRFAHLGAPETAELYSSAGWRVSAVTRGGRRV